MIRVLTLAALLAAFSLPAAAESCRRAGEPDARRQNPSDCADSERLQPYDPDRVRAGNRPGIIDLGNGTEVRVGGRVQFDYDTRIRR